MKTEHNLVTAENGHLYMMASSHEATLKARLQGWKAMQLFDMMKQQQPLLFLAKLQDNTLIPFLNGIVDGYHRRMETHLQNGWTEIEANEWEWWNLTVEAGIEPGPPRIRPPSPPHP